MDARTAFKRRPAGARPVKETKPQRAERSRDSLDRREDWPNAITPTAGEFRLLGFRPPRKRVLAD
jgi:hypothetical protein